MIALNNFVDDSLIKAVCEISNTIRILSHNGDTKYVNALYKVNEVLFKIRERINQGR